MAKQKKLKTSPERQEQKRIVEGFLTVISDPAMGLSCSSGQLHDVFQKIMDKIADEEKKKFFMEMNGYFFEIAELYYAL